MIATATNDLAPFPFRYMHFEFELGHGPSCTYGALEYKLVGEVLILVATNAGPVQEFDGILCASE